VLLQKSNMKKQQRMNISLARHWPRGDRAPFGRGEIDTGARFGGGEGGPGAIMGHISE
jgi:hypothetical protein